MPVFNSFMYVTRNVPGGEEQLMNAFSRLMDAERPYWEMRVAEKQFRFYAGEDFCFEDAVWQLMDYCLMSLEALQLLSQDLVPYDLEEELGAEYCTERRDNLLTDMLRSGLNIKLVTWPGCDSDAAAGMVRRMQDVGLSAVHFALSDQYRIPYEHNS